MEFSHYTLACCSRHDDACAVEHNQFVAFDVADGKVVQHTTIEFRNVVLVCLSELLIALHEVDQGRVILVNCREYVLQRHEAVHSEAGCNVVYGKFHLVRSEDGIPAQCIRDVVGFAGNPHNGEAEVQELLPYPD